VSPARILVLVVTVAIALGASGVARAQRPPAPAPAVYRATVLSRGTRRPIFGATVTIGAAQGFTAEDGRVQLGGLPAGPRTLVVEAGGFQRVEETIELRAGERLEEIVRMTAEGDNPYETVVRARRPREEVSRQTLEREELRTVPGTMGDPLRAILNLPGIARAPFGLGLLLVRGTGPDDSAVFVDGHEVPILYHFLGGPAVLNPAMLERIDFYPGNFPVRLGRAIGGVIDVGTHPGDAAGLHGEAKVDLLDSSLFVEGPVAGFTVSAAARRSYIDAILPALLPEPDEGVTLTVVPIYWDYQLRVDRKLSGRDRLSLLVFGSEDNLGLASTDFEAGEDVELDAHIGFLHAQALWRATLARGLTSTLSPMFGVGVVSLEAGTGTTAELGLTGFRLREDLAWAAARGLAVKGGLDLEHHIQTVSAFAPSIPQYRTFGGSCGGFGGGAGDGDGDGPPEAAGENVEIERDVATTNLAGWVEAVWDVPGGLKLVPGLRFERYAYGDVAPAILDPRLAFRYAFDGDTIFKTAVGLTHQPPGAQFLDEQFGNPRLDPERAEQYTVGFERQLSDALRLDLQVFYSSRYDLVVPSDAATVDGTVARELFANDGAGRSYGLELLLKHDMTRRLHGWISYTLSRSETESPDSEGLHPTIFDQTHNLIVVASVRLSGGWELGTRFRLTTGRPETPIVGATYDADSGGYCALPGRQGSVRGSVFSQLDLRVEKTWTFDLWRFAVFLDVQNVYNATNPEGTLWDYRFRESAPLPGLIFLPVLGLRGTL
jgi:outer membrane receptor protein involved in Fe transport